MALLLLMTTVLHAQQITGVIIDDETGDSIPYASVVYKGHQVAVASNIDGRYSIARHNGWVLSFSAVGYAAKFITVNANLKNKLNVRLRPDTKLLKEVTVRAKKYKYSRKNNPAVDLMKNVIERK